MSEREDSAHVVNSPIEEAEVIAYDRSQTGTGSIVIEVQLSTGGIYRPPAGTPAARRGSRALSWGPRLS